MSTSSSPFNPKSYYRFFNDVYPNNTMSTGLQYTVATSVNMTQAQTFTSSENWQIYSQSGRYFIRNYDAGSQVQLGLTTTSRTVPQLLPRSGDLGQQWFLTLRQDGTWRVSNALVGNQTSLGVSTGNTVPGMDTNENDGHWNIGINISAGDISDSGMLSDVQNVQAVPSSSTASVSGSPTGSSTSPTTTTPSVSSNQNSSSISPGAIAGIVIGIVAVFALLALILFLVRRRRRRRTQQSPGSELPAAPPIEIGEKDSYVAPETPPKIVDGPIAELAA